MNEFFKAFRAFCESGTLYNAVSGRMYTEMAPFGIDMPYAVWSFPSISTTYDLQNKADEGFSIQLDIYSKTEGELLSLFDAANVDFQFCSFEIPGYQLVEFKRVFTRKIKASGVKRFIIEFSVKIGTI